MTFCGMLDSNSASRRIRCCWPHAWPPATFLLRFESTDLRNAALANGGFYPSGASLRFMTWSRRFGATAGSLNFRARVCIEGLPGHAHQAETVAQLFITPSFVDEVDDNVEKEEEKSTFNLWIWTDAPSDLAVEGTLQIEEPIQLSDDFYLRLGNMELPSVREEAAKMLNYKVLIHLDCVIDYSPPVNPVQVGFGRPEDELTAQWPASYSFSWYLGVVDGLPPEGRPRRVSAHERLGGRRDRSSPHGGAGGGGSSSQQPPSAAWRGAPSAANRGPFRAGGVSRGAPARHGGRRWTSGTAREWRVKPTVSELMREDQTRKTSGTGIHNAGDRFLVRESLPPLHRKADPRSDKAGWAMDDGQASPACSSARWSQLRSMRGWARQEHSKLQPSWSLISNSLRTLQRWGSARIRPWSSREWWPRKELLWMGLMCW